MKNEDLKQSWITARTIQRAIADEIRDHKEVLNDELTCLILYHFSQINEVISILAERYEIFEEFEGLKKTFEGRFYPDNEIELEKPPELYEFPEDFNSDWEFEDEED